MSAPTEQQRRAIAADGNVLVVAGAGTGKTQTLVERCLARVCAAENPVSLEDVLLVTFTEAAAAEMRKRLREELEQRAAAQPERVRLAEQLALVETARISTLHSFCLQLVREHFHELQLDPQLAVLAEEAARLLARETLDRLLQRHYAGGTPIADAVQQLVLDHGRGWDQPVRKLTLRLHHYTQTLRDPEAWFREQLAQLEQTSPAHWLRWLADGFLEWRTLWQPVLRDQPKENTVAHQCAEKLDAIPGEWTRERMAGALATIIELGGPEHWPRGTKGKFRDPIAGVFDEAAFLHALAALASGGDPLAEDWNWIRPQMKALLGLAQEFTAEFARAKRDLAVVDFHDLEQFALQLLLDRRTGRPSAIAQLWRERLRLVFVDEYQDINAAQDAILRALGGEGRAANRFLVGDVKQSIYRFRLADPKIFQGYKDDWEKNAGKGRTIPLSDNFRSHEGILKFVNGLFAALMRREAGGVEYDEPQQLRFGTPEERRHFAIRNERAARVELHLILTGRDDAERDTDPASDEPADLTAAEREARLVALRLRELKRRKFQVWDKDMKQLRDVEWGDMAILLRSPRNKAEGYAKAFDQLGVPLIVARGGFFESLEVTDLLSLLQALDNPLQDLPLLAALHAPLAGLTPDELAAIRLAQRHGPFWTALIGSQKSEVRGQNAGAQRKIGTFISRFARWRQLARQASLSQCLEAVLDETQYEAWLSAQPRGGQRLGNVRRLVSLTRQFDQFQRQGLFRFLKFVEAQLDAEVDLEPAPPPAENAVQLMSIHQSKGLDFPVVVAADLGKRFNFDDLKERVILDEEFGLCPKVKPPHCARVYPSLPYWLAQRRQRRETLGEEMRLLYVALTRARDTLILTGTMTRKSATEKWAGRAAGRLPLPDVLAARNYLDWLGGWLPGATGHGDWTTSGQSALLAWTVYGENDARLLSPPEPAAGASESEEATETISPAGLQALSRKLEWRYPFAVATVEPAKTSVSALRRRLREETDDEARALFQVPRDQFPMQRRAAANRLSAAEIGTAHHSFLERVALDQTGTRQDLRNEAERLRQAAVLSEAEVAALDFAGLQAFWESALGRTIRAQPPRNIHRELPFTVRMSRADLQAAQLPVCAGLTDDEFVVVQGVADLVVLLPEEIRLVDFKTDKVTPDELEAKKTTYAPQIKLYALALSRIYGRPVTECWLHFLSCRKSRAVTL